MRITWIERITDRRSPRSLRNTSQTHGNQGARAVEKNKVRLDKYLWAARFFKTRAKAKEAIDGGKIHVDGVRGKAGKEVRMTDEIRIRQGWEEKTVKVTGLSEQRRGAPEAALLYEETETSKNNRALIADQRKAAGAYLVRERRPTKKDRRQIHKFKEQKPD